jgi:poly-gamma-glutamate system protein
MKLTDPTSPRPAHRLYSPRRLVALAMAALLIAGVMELCRTPAGDRFYTVKLSAAHNMQSAMRILRTEHLNREISLNTEHDPNATGLIGPEYTEITTTLGYLEAKRTSLNPNMAGVIVAMLGRCGVQPGDCAAVSFSGSFPAMNLAVLCALDAMGLSPVIVSSVGASSYGATDPRFTWLDMERTLHDQGLIPWLPTAVAPGGVAAQPRLDPESGLSAMRAAVQRSGRPYLDERNGETLRADVQRRLDLYRTGCGGRPKVFINVGGNLTALGECPDADRLPNGLLPPGIGVSAADCGVIYHMAEAGIPVIHILDIRKIARDYGLPMAPVPLPSIPAGRVMTQGGYSKPFAAVGLVILIIVGAWSARKNVEYPLQVA